MPNAMLRNLIVCKLLLLFGNVTHLPKSNLNSLISVKDWCHVQFLLVQLYGKFITERKSIFLNCIFELTVFFFQRMQGSALPSAS